MTKNIEQFIKNLRTPEYVKNWFDQIGFEAADVIQALQDENTKLREVVTDLASKHTLSEHCGELDYLIDDAKEALKPKMKMIHVLSVICCDYEWETKTPFGAFTSLEQAEKLKEELHVSLYEAIAVFEEKERAIVNSNKYDDDDYYIKEEKAIRLAELKCFRGLPYGLHLGIDRPDYYENIVLDTVKVYD